MWTFAFPRPVWLLSLVMWCILGACTAEAPVPPVQTVEPDARFAAVRARIDTLVARAEVPSLAVAVVQNGQTLWQEAFGWADVAQGVAATPSTVYRIGSLSKSMMATGVMTLVEQGQLGLDDPVSPILAPGRLVLHEGAAADVKVWHLLNMSAGLPHGWISYSAPGYAPQTSEEKDAFLQWMGQVVFPPGTVYHYSNFSMGVPEWLIERVSGQSFSEYMNQALFFPLGMRQTGVRIEPHFEDLVATPYDSRLAPLDDAQYVVGSGGLGFYASVHDLALFGRFHLQDRMAHQQDVLSPETLHLMHTFDRGPDTLFGLGWFKVHHLVSNGSVSGGNARLTLVPAQNLAVACVTNMTSPVSIADQVCDEITEVLIPGTQAEGGQIYEAYMRRYEAPYAPVDALTGTWTGTVQPHDRPPVPLSLTFAPDGAVQVRLDNQAPVPLENLTFGHKAFLEGRFQGYVRVHPAQPEEPGAVQLRMQLDQNRLFGYAAMTFSTDEGSFRLPAYVTLTRP